MAWDCVIIRWRNTERGTEWWGAPLTATVSNEMLAIPRNVVVPLYRVRVTLKVTP